MVNSGTDSLDVFLGYGDGTFADQITYSTGSGSVPYALTVGDLNNDHQLDIIVANFGTNNIDILLGNGHGNFTSQTTLSTGSAHPRYVALGDFNNDAQLDIVVANYGTDNIGVFFGYGNGNFTTQITLSTAYDSLPFALVVGDFNSDHNLDIAVANYGTNNVGIFLGYGNQSFASQMTFSTGIDTHPHSIAMGYINHDTHLDIVVANSGTNTVGALFGYGNGSFGIQTNYFTGMNSLPYSVAIGDLEDDNQLDIVAGNFGTDNIGVFFGYSNGTFEDQKTFTTGINSNPISVIISDFNTDNRSDIAVVNYGTNNVDILLGYIENTFGTQTIYPTGDYSYPQSMVIGDLNNDSCLDIVVANYGYDEILVFWGYGDGTFPTQDTYSTGYYSLPTSVVMDDVNSDSRLDIVVANYGNDNVGVLLGYGNGTFSQQQTYSTGSNSQPTAVALGDFNSDHRLDIVVANYEANNLGIFIGCGNGNFTEQQTYSTGSGSNPNWVAIGDLNDDNHVDIVVALAATSFIGIFFGYGDGTFAEQVLYSIASRGTPYSVVLGDLNNDNRLDIAVSISFYWSSGVGIFLGYGNGTFAPVTLFVTGFGSIPAGITLADLNNNNILDIIVANYGTNNVGVFFGVGDGTFLEQVTYSTGNFSSPYSVALGDFNKDGRLDIAVTNLNTSNVGILFGIEIPNFRSFGAYSTGSAAHPRYVVVGDFNNDTKLDIAVANSGTDSVGVLLGYENATFAAQTTFSTGSLSFPISLVVADFSNDNILDIVVANSFTNNIGIFYGFGNGTFESLQVFWTENGTQPQSIASGDFNNDNRLDIAVANYDADNVNVLLRCDDARFQNEVIYSSGGDTEPLSVAVGDFNNDSWLDIVVANSLGANLGVFLGYGNGTFSAQRTYPTGVGSLPQTVVVGDVNNDEHLDLVVTNALKDNIGIFLGYGNGTFSDQMIYPTEYGSTPVSVALGDFNNDGNLDIVNACYWTSDIGIFFGYGNGTFSDEITYSTGYGSNPNSVVVGDFNNDSILDIAVTNQGSRSIGIFLGCGDGNFLNETMYSTGNNSKPTTMTVGDFNNDAILDITVSNFGTGNIGVFFGHHDGTFSDQMTFSTGGNSQPWWVAVGDFNNDHRPDIVTANTGTNNIGIFVAFINGTFFDQMTYSTGISSSPISVAVGDFNNDGRLDIVVANRDRGSIGLFFGYAHDGFLSTPAYSTGFSSRPVHIVVGDFNNDNQLDLAVANNGTDNIMIFLGSGFGTFSSPTNYSTGKGSHPCSIAIGDFNNDRIMDIAVGNFGSSTISIFLGHGNLIFLNQTTYSVGIDSQPYSIAVCDFNNDTHLDVAVANYASNNVGLFLGYGNGTFMNQIIFSGGFNSQPSALAVGDFNGDRVMDFIAANNGYNNLEVLSMC